MRRGEAGCVGMRLRRCNRNNGRLGSASIMRRCGMFHGRWSLLGRKRLPLLDCRWGRRSGMLLRVLIDRRSLAGKCGRCWHHAGTMRWYPVIWAMIWDCGSLWFGQGGQPLHGRHAGVLIWRIHHGIRRYLRGSSLLAWPNLTGKCGRCWRRAGTMRWHPVIWAMICDCGSLWFGQGLSPLYRRHTGVLIWRIHRWIRRCLKGSGLLAWPNRLAWDRG